MQIIITVRTGTAAMQTWGDVRDAVTAAIEQAAWRNDADMEPSPTDPDISVWDVNGNRVGTIAALEDR